MYRIWIEEVLGFQLRGSTLALRAVLPQDWPGFEITYRYRTAVYHIVVRKDFSITRTTIAVDGGKQETRDMLELHDDGRTHEVKVHIWSKAQVAKIADGSAAMQNGAAGQNKLPAGPPNPAENPTGSPTAVSE
jgi:hypothetical protein